MPGADVWEPTEASPSVTYDRRERIALAAAVDWAHAHPADVTLYLYDAGGRDAIEHLYGVVLARFARRRRMH